MAIPDLLDRELKLRRLSERGLATYLGVSSNAVNAWRRGLRTPDPRYCEKIAEYLGLPVDLILTEAGHICGPGAEAPTVVR